MQKTKDEESVLLYLSTEHATTRNEGTWTVNMGNSIFVEKAKMITPLSVTLTHLFPNINQYNNTILVGSVTYTIPIGFYTTAELITAMNTLLAPETVSLALVDGVIVASTVTDFKTFIPQSTDLSHVLGVPFQILLRTATPLTFLHPPNLSGEKLVHIACDKMAHGNLIHGADGKLHDILATVHLSNVAYGFTTTFKSQDIDAYSIQYKYSNSLTSSLNFRLLDSQMRNLSYAENLHCQILTKVYHGEHDAG